MSIDIRKMSKETDIPIEKIKEVCCHPRAISTIRIRLNSAKTIEEIIQVYYITPNNSEIEKEAIMKLAKFYEE